MRALTASHPIKPTSPRCPSAWQPNHGRGSTYRCGKSVQTTGTTSINDLQTPFLLAPVFQIRFRPCALEMVIELVNACEVQIGRVQQVSEFCETQISAQSRFGRRSVTKERVHRLI